MKSIDELGLDQIVAEPTHGENTVDSSNIETTGNIQAIPGISDHTAVYCELKLNRRTESGSVRHPVFLYDKLKIDISDFQIDSSNPHFNSVQENYK